MLFIRPMRLGDLDRVMTIEKSSFLYPWQRKSFEMEIGANNLSEYLVACECNKEDSLVAYAGMWYLKNVVHITNLAVDPLYRNYGIGSYLLRCLKYRARLKGAISMSLEVRPSNKVAQILYRKCGFKICKVRSKYYHDEDALVMKATLLDSATLHPGNR